MSSHYIDVLSEKDFAAAKRLARGSYQYDVAIGEHSWSGATLHGKAAIYRSRYKQSRHNWLSRCRKAGIDICIARREHNRLVIVYGV